MFHNNLPLLYLSMTFPDPVVQEFRLHLDSLYADSTITPDEELLIRFEDKIRYDAALHNEVQILYHLAPIILQIINSNETTGECKEYVISLLDILLPYYTFKQVTSIFNQELLLKAIHDKRLKLIIIKLLIRGDVEFLRDGQLFKCLFNILADPNEPIAIVNLTERAIVAIVMKSDIFRLKLLNDYEITNIMNDMKHNKIVQSRLIDLICEVLPVVPTLDTSKYLIGEEEISLSNDLLFYRFSVDTWKRLLLLLKDNEDLGFLKNKMEPQLDFCSRLFVGENTLLDGNDVFIDYEDFGTVQCLTRLSYVVPELFAQFDSKYHLIDYAMDKYCVYEKAVFFLTGVNTIFLREKNADFFEKFKLSHRTIDLFCHLILDTFIASHYFDKSELQKIGFDKLIFDDLLQIFSILSSSDILISKMVNDCPYIITKVINTNINNEVFVKTQLIESSLNAIVASNVPLGNLQTPIEEKIKDLRGQVYITVEEPLTEHI